VRWEVCLALGSGIRQTPGFGGFSVARPRRVHAVGLVVDDHHKALARGVLAPGAGVVGAAKPVVRGIEESLEHHWVWHAGEVPLRVPMRGGEWQLAGGAVVGLVVGGGDEVPYRQEVVAGKVLYAATSVLADKVYVAVALRIPWGTAARESCAPPRVRPLTRWRVRRAVRRCERPDVVPFTPDESAGRSVVGVEVLKGPQRPPGWALGRQQWT
jgi:hypothetical protein